MCLALVVALCLASLFVGARATTFSQVWEAIPGGFRYAFDPGAPADEFEMLLGIQRLPRTLLALIAGTCLGAAGALTQAFTRNPLADPGILGVTAGAAAAVALAVSTGVTDSFVWPAILGAVLVTSLLFALNSSGSPLTFVLAGMALSAVLMALVNALVLTNDEVLDAIRQWATGSVAGRDFGTVEVTAPIGIVSLVAAILLSPLVNLVLLGDATAQSLGVPVSAVQAGGVIVIAGLTGAAVAAAGPVAFIGLAAPHITRRLAGVDYRLIVPLSGLVGGVCALLADILGRLLARPGELPMGIVLALLGVPIFILLVRGNKIGGNL
ncbi:FecCD family ABC transporter permease [Corynebacterium sp. LK2536]|uniref:FecCD family ABC transporter permease n=1 Tax=Corynebacterium sp. LK2536 TaxID=3110470 RepID=UPI0034CE1C71